MFWDIVIVAGVFWVVMSIFSFIQSIHIKNIYKTLEPSGHVYFGKDAGIFRTKYYVFAAVDGHGKVEDAKILKSSRIVTLSKVEDFPALKRKELSSINTAKLNLDSRLEIATNKLISNFRKHQDKQSRVPSVHL